MTTHTIPPETYYSNITKENNHPEKHVNNKVKFEFHIEQDLK